MTAISTYKAYLEEMCKMYPLQLIRLFWLLKMLEIKQVSCESDK